jgi:hypothetical protein
LTMQHSTLCLALALFNAELQGLTLLALALWWLGTQLWNLDSTSTTVQPWKWHSWLVSPML